MLIYCITCKNRCQHLKLTLPKNLRDNEECKFVILNYNTGDDLLSYLFNNHLTDIKSGRIILYNYYKPGPFRMAHAKNMVHRLGILEGGTILCNLDSDNYTGYNFTDYIQYKLKSNSFLWSRMKKGELSRGISGRIVVTKDAFIKSGGYNEKYETWGPDDKDFNARLQRMGYKGIEIDDEYLKAVPHNDKMRFKEYRHIQTSMTEEDFDISDDLSTIANYGQIGKGVVYKNFDFFNPIELKSIPTRIFGIGLHKTATTSLHTALQILGYNSAHWKSAHWAKAIWHEMNILGHSETLEKHYALCDLPIPLIYKELDLAYPGSKFILTIRDTKSWLNSVLKHFDKSNNKFRNNWDSDPFSHFIHKELYGTQTPDVETLLKTYIQHNQEVINYFSNRPNDLLILKNNSWKELCSFLEQPIPNIPYPNRNISNE